MPIYNAHLEVECDGCGHNEYVEMAYTYNDYSGDSGQYDEDRTKEEMEKDGWNLGGRVLCPACAEDSDGND